jgi:sec-independent protein translocase protein TatB
MFDFDAGKLVIIGIVALVVIGPKELPRVLRQVGQAVAKMRRLAAEFQGQFMEAMREADMADIKADVAKLAESAKLDVNFDPIHDLKTQISDAVDGKATATPSTAGVPEIAGPHDGDAAAEAAATAVTDVPPNLPAPAEGDASLAGTGIAPAAPEASPALPEPNAAAPEASEVRPATPAEPAELHRAAAEPMRERAEPAVSYSAASTHEPQPTRNEA